MPAASDSDSAAAAPSHDAGAATSETSAGAQRGAADDANGAAGSAAGAHDGGADSTDDGSSLTVRCASAGASFRAACPSETATGLHGSAVVAAEAVTTDRTCYCRPSSAGHSPADA